MTEYTKAEAMALARDDFRAGRHNDATRVYEVWGGTTGYLAMRDGIYRVMRHDSGGTIGLTRHTVRVVRAEDIITDDRTYAIYQCQCGDITGEPCQWTGPAVEMVVLEWMPVHLRASHKAAGASGSYPHNGAARLAVEASCADRLRDDWTTIVDVPIAGYLPDPQD